jgi:hypothetical protein
MKRYNPDVKYLDNEAYPEMRECLNGELVYYDELPHPHDLRKDPADLPTDDRMVLVLDEHGGTHNDKHLFGGNWLSRSNAIAWQELPGWEGVE